MDSWKNHKLDWICVSEEYCRDVIILDKTYEEVKLILKENYPKIPKIYWDIEIATDIFF